MQRTGSAPSAPSSLQSGSPDALPARSKSAISSAAFAGAGSRRPAATWMKASTAARSGSSPAKSERSDRRRRRVERSSARWTVAEVGAAAQRERHRLAEADEAVVGVQAQEQHLAPLERPRARSRRGSRNGSA